MSVWIGIDGGGTALRVMMQRESELPQYFEKNVSMKVIGGNYVKSAELLRGVIQEILRDNPAEIKSIVIGLSGMSRELDQQNLQAAICSLFGADLRVKIQSDATLALEASLRPEEFGILLIAGTGSVGYVRSAEGLHRMGGWGPLLSDEGSGYWIGMRALQYFVLAFEEREERDSLYDAILSALPAELRETPILLAQHLELHPSYPATFAEIVFDLAETSGVAAEIIETAAGLLSGLLKTGLDLLDEEESTVPIILSGSIAKHRLIVKYLTHMLFESGVELRLLDEKALAQKALEIAKSLT